MMISKPTRSTVDCARPGCSKLAIHLWPTRTGACMLRTPSFFISSHTYRSVASSSHDRMILSPASWTSTLSRIDPAMGGGLVESGRREYRLDRRRLQILDELVGEVRVGRRGHDARGIGRGGLDLLGQGTDQLEALGLELPDLGDGGEADLHALAAHHVL